MQTENRLYFTPFSADYWKTAAAQLHHLPTLVLAALFVALRVAVSSFRIPVADNLNIMFTYAVASAGSMIYGPVLGLITGFASDIIGFLWHPMGAFFPGYTISEMLGSLIYALFLYRTRITVTRVVLCKATVNIFINIGLGCLWSAIQFEHGYLYYLAKSIVKNLILLPIESALIIVVLQAIIPIAVAARFLPASTPKLITLWGRKKETAPDDSADAESRPISKGE